MADNDPNNDEYKLDDLDLLASEPEDRLEMEDEVSEPLPVGSKIPIAKPWENPVVLKGLMAVGGLILIVLCYKMFQSFFSSNSSDKNQIQPAVIQPKTFTQNQQIAPMTTNEGSVSKKLSSIQQEQNSMNATLQTMSSQVTTLGSSVSDATSKITVLTANMAVLAEKMEAQTQAIERILAANAPKKPVSHPMKRRPGIQNQQAVIYSIQAIIPGRAWLIANNGATMTVREGSPVAGYGVIKLIDAEQGRVLTSSGRVIRFSQVDS